MTLEKARKVCGDTSLFLGLLWGLLGILLYAPLAHADTFRDSASYAIIYHPTVEARKAGQKASSEEINEQRSNYYPTVTVDASTGRIHADDDTTRSLTGDSDESYTGSGSITLNQMLFDGFEVSNRVGAAEARETVAEFEVARSSEDVALRAVQAHINVMRTRELFDFAADYISKLQEYVFNIDLLVKGGAADEAELLQAQELIMIAQNSLIGFEEQAEKAEAEYLEVVGHLPGEQLVSSNGWKTHLPETLEQAIDSGINNHPQVVAARKSSEALDHEKGAEKAQIVPKFNAELSYSESDQDDNLSGERTSAQALVRMSWSFSTGGAYAARVRRAAHRHAESVAREHEALRTIEKDIRTAFTEMISAEKREGLMAERKDASQGVLETYNKQFEGGQRTLLQIIGAENRLFDSAVAHLNAQYRSLLANFQYLSAMGRLRTALEITAEENDGDNG